MWNCGKSNIIPTLKLIVIQVLGQLWKTNFAWPEHWQKRWKLLSLWYLNGKKFRKLQFGRVRFCNFLLAWCKKKKQPELLAPFDMANANLCAAVEGNDQTFGKNAKFAIAINNKTTPANLLRRRAPVVQLRNKNATYYLLHE